MKKQYLLFSFLLLLSVSLLAQVDSSPEPVSAFQHYHQKKSSNFHLGIGFPNIAGAVLSGIEQFTGIEAGKTSPQFTLKYEYGLNDQIGIGLHTGFYTAKTPTLGAETISNVIPIDQICCLLDPNASCCNEQTETMTVEEGFTQINAFSVGGRFTYHFRKLEKLDTYTSVVLGYSFIREKVVGAERSEFNSFIKKVPTFVYFTSVGARYFIDNKWGVYGEVGYGSITLLNLGLTMRMMPVLTE